MIDWLHPTLKVSLPGGIKSFGGDEHGVRLDEHVRPPPPLDDQKELRGGSSGCWLDNQVRFLKNEGGKRPLLIAQPGQNIQLPAQSLRPLELERFTGLGQFRFEFCQHVNSLEVKQAKYLIHAGSIFVSDRLTDARPVATVEVELQAGIAVAGLRLETPAARAQVISTV